MYVVLDKSYVLYLVRSRTIQKEKCVSLKLQLESCHDWWRRNQSQTRLFTILRTVINSTMTCFMPYGTSLVLEVDVEVRTWFRVLSGYFYQFIGSSKLLGLAVEASIIPLKQMWSGADEYFWDIILIYIYICIWPGTAFDDVCQSDVVKQWKEMDSHG
jgi:hypothetical protein